MATHFHSLKIKDIRKETPECISIAFEIPEELKDQFRYSHGQNITLKINIGGEEMRRSYSICSSPLENELRVAVKKVVSGKFSSFVNAKLRKGDSVDVLPPTGKFYTELDKTQAKNYLAFAAGSGITPILSIIKTSLGTEASSGFTLVYGNRNRTSIIFKEELEALKNRYMDRFTIHHILSREKTEAPINQGRIDVEKCVQLGKLLDIRKIDEFFLCGPEEMIFQVSEWLQKDGVNKKNIHFELFNPPGQTSSIASTPIIIKPEYQGMMSRVTIKIDGVAFELELPFDGPVILDAALKKGADLPFACKGGVCSTCRARLIEGEVEMETNYALEPEEISAGFILTCQSHPRTERVVVDFDTKY